MALTTCPDCNARVSDEAPTCPQCGRTRRAPKAGFGATLSKWCFWGWNALMIAWLFTAGAKMGDAVNEASTAAERAGAEAGAGLGVAFILFVWCAGAVITGLWMRATRPR